MSLKCHDFSLIASKFGQKRFSIYCRNFRISIFGESVFLDVICIKKKFIFSMIKLLHWKSLIINNYRFLRQCSFAWFFCVATFDRFLYWIVVKNALLHQKGQSNVNTCSYQAIHCILLQKIATRKRAHLEGFNFMTCSKQFF